MEQFGFKDFESVRIKATYDIELGDRQISEGETIAYFDKIQISGFEEVKQYVTAHGGFNDRDLVFWETTKELDLSFSQGVFSKEQFSLLANSKLIDIAENTPIKVTEREIIESNENKQFTLKNMPIGDIYVYEKENGKKITYYRQNKLVTVAKAYTEYIVDYVYNYVNGAKIVDIGSRLLNGYVELEGRTRVKDDTTGQIKTGIIKIPKLRLMSKLSMRLGAQANPIVANFRAKGAPVGSKGEEYVLQMYFLEDDIGSDL